MSRQIPQGIEVLVLKAAVDPDFKQLLLQRRTAAAAAIGLELSVAEATMLAAVPVAQLEAVIARASVPQEHRRAFLGQAAAAMLAALGAVSAAWLGAMAFQGIGPGLPPPKQEKAKTVGGRVIEVIAKRTSVEATQIKRGDALVRDLKVKPADLDQLRKDLEKEFDIKVPAADFKKVRFVGNVIARVEKAIKSKTPPPKPSVFHAARARATPVQLRGDVGPQADQLRTGASITVIITLRRDGRASRRSVMSTMETARRLSPVADITLINLNMLFMRYGEEVERELHVPLGPLYLTRALEDAGFSVDFRDYQCVDSDQPFDMEVFLDFLHDPAPVIGLSCMANLLPFTILAMRAIRARYPDRVLVLGGVGTKAVEEKLLTRFPWINIICRGEAERTAPELLHTIRRGGDLAAVAGLSFRTASGAATSRTRPTARGSPTSTRSPFPPSRRWTWRGTRATA